jgi:hypothetical protein
MPLATSRWASVLLLDREHTVEAEEEVEVEVEVEEVEEAPRYMEYSTVPAMG